MALLRAQPLTSRNHGLLNAAALGVLAAGLLVQVPRAVVALSSVAEALIRALVPASASPQGPGALVLLLALPIGVPAAAGDRRAVRLWCRHAGSPRG
ncbi:MAG: hypothetical protein U0Z44_17900 [Kouleothrix sp.]